MCPYKNILTKRKHQFNARSQRSGSKLLAPTVPTGYGLPQILGKKFFFMGGGDERGAAALCVCVLTIKWR